MGFRRYLIGGLLSFLFVPLLLCGGMLAVAGDALLSWSPSPSDDIMAYRVYSGNSPRVYSAPITIGNQKEYTITGLSTGTWYFAVTAVDIEGNESDYSNEVLKTIGATSDATPPVISAVNSLSVTGAGATIAWTTNEASNSQVEYGTTTGYGKSAALNSSMVTSHSQGLSGLTAGTLYYYRVKSTDASGNAAVSGDYTFKTPATVDSAVPVISSITSSNITSAGVKITWVTNEASSSQIEYGTTTGYGKSFAVNSPMVTSHTQSLTGLSANTMYHYRVKSTDAAGNVAVSGDYTFKTPAAPDTAAPVISGVSSSNLTSTGATIAWTTNEASNSQVEYGTTANYGTSANMNNSMVTAHVQSLSGLLAGTLYHYRVKSMDASGNRASSGDYTFKTAASDDTDSTMFARWFRSDAVQSENDPSSDSPQISFASKIADALGQTISRLGVHADAAPPQMSATSSLKVAAGNVAISRDSVIATTASGAAPVISRISVSDITNQSARISWSASKSSDSEVEYWPASGSSSKAVLSDFSMQHSITLNNLKAGTRYQFNVKSADPAGNQAKSKAYTLTTLSGNSSVVALPRFFDLQDQNEMGDEVLTEIAVTNLGNQTATLTLTAMDIDGNLITGQNITNPNRFQVSPRSQVAKLDMDIFGEGLELTGSRGWIKVESTTSGTGGFSLAFGSDMSFADGTSLGESPLTDFAFTEIEANGSTRINVANNNPDDTAVAFDLMKADGTVSGSQSRVIKANGALVADLFADLFTGVRPDAANYVRVKSTEGLLSFELTKRVSGDISSLPGQDVTTGGRVLYSPHYVSGSEWKTSLSVINLDSRAGRVQFQFVGENGVQIGTARTLDIPAKGKLYINDAAFFSQPGLDTTYTGYVKISSDGVRLAGSTVFGDSSGKAFSSALPLIYSLQKSVLYGHAVSNDLYRSGIAIVNPNDTLAIAVVELFAADGKSIEKKYVYIPAKQRRANLLTEYFPSQKGLDQTSGYLKITSQKPLASYSLFGTRNLSVLSAIPSKVIP